MFGIIFGTNFWDSGHVQQSKYTVFDEESDFQVKNGQILQPEGKVRKNLPYKMESVPNAPPQAR